MQFVVSDSQTFLTATVERTAAETFQRVTGQSLSSRNLGGVIEIQECEIVATHFGPRGSRVTLFITRLKPLGCDGLATIGTPRPSHGIEEIVRASERLGIYRTQCKGSISTNPTKYSPSPIRLSSQTALTQCCEPTQPSYSTQAIRAPKRRKLTSPNDLSSDEQYHHLNHANFVVPLPALNQPNGHNDTNDMPPTPDRGGLPLQSDPIQRSPQKSEQTVATSRREPIGHAESLLKVLLGGPASDMTGLVEHSEKGKASAAPTDKTAILPANTKAFEGPELAESDGEKKRERNVELVEEGQLKVQGQNKRVTNGQVSRKSLLKKNNRISTREVMIPKDQRKLLDSHNAWLPPEPGQRGPVANVPISLLQTWNEEAQAKSKRKMDPSASPTTSHASNDPSQQSSDDSEDSRVLSDDHESFDSSEWPASQEPDHVPAQLPPDSSAPKPPVIESLFTVGTQHEENKEHLEQLDRKQNYSPSQQFEVVQPQALPAQEEGQASLDSHQKFQELDSQKPGTNSHMHSGIVISSTTDSDTHLINSLSTDTESADRPTSFQIVQTHEKVKPSQPIESPNETSNRADALDIQGLAAPVPESSTLFSQSQQEVGELSASPKGSREVDGRGSQESSDFIDSPPSQESDLDTMVPTALERKGLPQSVNSTSNSMESNNSLRNLPKLQMKRTPYVNSFGEVPRTSGASPTKADNHQIDLTESSWPSQLPGVNVQVTQELSQQEPDRSTEASHCLDGPMHSEPKVVEEKEMGNQPSLPLAPESAHNELPALRRPSQLAKELFLEQCISNQALEAKMIMASVSNTKDKENPGQARNRDSEKIVFGGGSSASPRQAFPNGDQAMSSPISPLTSVHPDHWASNRCDSESIASSLRSAKRRKTFQLPSAFNFTQESQEIDPRILAKKARQEFFESRKQSLTSDNSAVTSAQVSPTEVVNGVPAAVNGVRSPLNGRFSPDIKAQWNNKAEDVTTPKVHAGNALEDQSLDPSSEDDADNVQSQSISVQLPLAPIEDAEHDSYPKDPGAQSSLEATRPDPAIPIPDTQEREHQSGHNETSATSNGDGSEIVYVAGQGPSHIVRDVLQDSIPPSAPHIIESSPALTQDTVEAAATSRTAKTSMERWPEAQSISSSSTIYDRFKAAYPDFSGDLEYFVAICNKVNDLVKVDKMEHKSLWDDFIVRHKIDFPKYLLRCADRAENPLPYEQFYRSEIDEAAYTKRVVTPKTLSEVLALKPPKSRERNGTHTPSEAGVGAKEPPAAGNMYHPLGVNGSLRSTCPALPFISRRDSTPSLDLPTSKQQKMPRQAAKPRLEQSRSAPKSPPLRPTEPPSSPPTIDLTIEDSEEDRCNARAAGPLSPHQDRKSVKARLERRRSKRMGSPELTSSPPAVPKVVKNVASSSGRADPSKSKDKESIPITSSSPVPARRLVGSGTSSSSRAGGLLDGQNVLRPFVAHKGTNSSARHLHQNASSSIQDTSKAVPSKPKVINQPRGPFPHDLHKDPDSRYNRFMRDYFEIRPGNSNAFAIEKKERQEEEGTGQQRGNRETDNQAESQGASSAKKGGRKIDFLKWEI